MKKPAQMTFLIVDDVDNMRRSIRAMLKLIGYGRFYQEAANGRDALKILQEADPPVDFIISDYNMPHVSGTELLNNVRADKKLRDIPFLMITAEANMEVVAEAAEHDVDAYMTKPFVTATLEQKINELLALVNTPLPITMHLRQLADLEEEGDLDGALIAARKAVEAKPGSSRPYRETGRLLFKKGALKQALGFFQKAIELNRLDVPSYHHMGQIYHQLGDTDKAIENYSRAMTISPRHADRALNFAQLLIDQGKREEAQKVLRLLFKTNSSDLEMKERLILFCAAQGIHELAARASRELLKEDPSKVHIYKHLGIGLYHSGLYQDAAQALEKAAQETETDVELWLVLAKTYQALKMVVRTEKWATRVIRVDSANMEAKEILNQCL